MPSLVPSVEPTAEPTALPSPQPPSETSPSPPPEVQPSAAPSAEPTPHTDPQPSPSAAPSAEPSAQPSTDPQALPTAAPSPVPTGPSAEPTAEPSAAPSPGPSPVPTPSPSAAGSVLGRVVDGGDRAVAGALVTFSAETEVVSTLLATHVTVEPLADFAFTFASSGIYMMHVLPPDGFTPWNVSAAAAGDLVLGADAVRLQLSAGAEVAGYIFTLNDGALSVCPAGRRRLSSLLSLHLCPCRLRVNIV